MSRKKKEGSEKNIQLLKLSENIHNMFTEKTGIVAVKNKMNALSNHISKTFDQNGINGLEDMRNNLAHNDQSTLQKLITLASNQESWFFREPSIFQELENLILPCFQQSKKDNLSLKIWSIGCGKGQEAYSLAMLLQEMRQDFLGWDIQIHATDLSYENVSQASEGLFKRSELKGVPDPYITKYFNPVGDDFRVVPKLKERIKFSYHNVLEQPHNHNEYDIVFCSYVLNQFHPIQKSNALKNLAYALSSGGFLVLGSNETLLSYTNLFEIIKSKRGIYRYIE